MEKTTLPEVAQTAEELYKLADKCGILCAMKVAFGHNVAVTIKVPKSLLNTPIEDYDFDQRVNNILSQWCKKNSGKPRTMHRVVDLIAMGDRAKEFIPRYGKQTQSKLKSFILGESYERLTEAEKREFCVNAIIQNCRFEEML